MYDEQRSHFGLWCIMAAPLLAGTDIVHASRDTLQILTARELIELNKDAAAAMAGCRAAASARRPAAVRCGPSLSLTARASPCCC